MDKASKAVKREAPFLDMFFYGFTFIAAFLTLYPFLNIIAVSFSDHTEFLKNPMMIIPSKITFEAFTRVLGDASIKGAYFNTIFVTVIGTFIGITLTILMAYPLSKKDLAGRKIFMNMLIFTMLFSGGIIPSFLLVRGIGLYDTLWALILPVALVPFNVIIVRTFFDGFPESLEEAARIDGASDPYILFKIIIPLSKPIIATMILFLAVMYWNSYFTAVIYIRSSDKWTLQLLLREIIYSAQAMYNQTGGDAAEAGIQTVSPITIQYASLIVAVLPILCVYPFLQKYFASGVMIGAVKG